jgi:lysozyme family protein
MDTFTQCLQIILAEEGGLSNYRQDPDSLTRFGISQHNYSNVGITNLTIQQANFMGLNLSNAQIAQELGLNPDNVQQMTKPLRQEIVARPPELILSGEVECDEV